MEVDVHGSDPMNNDNVRGEKNYDPMCSLWCILGLYQQEPLLLESSLIWNFKPTLSRGRAKKHQCHHERSCGRMWNPESPILLGRLSVGNHSSLIADPGFGSCDWGRNNYIVIVPQVAASVPSRRKGCYMCVFLDCGSSL